MLNSLRSTSSVTKRCICDGKDRRELIPVHRLGFVYQQNLDHETHQDIQR